MTSYRACYYTAEDGQGSVVLTGEDEAGMTDADLISHAMFVADESGLIGDVTGLTAQDVRDRLTIGAWNG